MNKLNYELKNLCKRNHDGAFVTQKNRHNGLQLIASQLESVGFHTRVMSVHDLKGKHVNRLVSLWKQQALSDATMKNRLAMLRWWAEKIGNPGAVKTSEEYGIGRRQLVTNESKAETLAGKDLSTISPWVALSLRLQEAFGLRREESMKFRVSWALKGQSPDNISAISLKPSWTKGGRPRSIPVLTQEQRQLLAEVRQLTGSGSLIPPDRSYREHLRVFERETASVGTGHTHGLRHAYAQRRYEELSGRKPPVLGGSPRRAMRREERRKDDEIRRQISEELGHSRISVTSIYLGT
ncbi:TPA: integrase domain-containing protein [Salmonella enterica subsp. enterica serovar Welikade]|nr:integrase domain-containing protein [Salmonella enterica subsp. enterica serovar Welikade]HBI5536834.1 integrase domain-containing protein [Salmonella enterica subsp. enterica serovar Welikade]HBI5585949.1 integrase domain-containing protein [Salmonella enterica subsp. enterica serovar Welikade]HBI5609024.1 integrase domain-containing protein [Salmonella enterica subsp. enterica serovar Welikade]HBI5646981.1 integrase domain-containing protein [Salmonella enterica subsp. enterica serovar Wel